MVSVFFLRQPGSQNATAPQRAFVLLLFAFCLFLTACKAEVYTGLNEEQANLMLGTLLKRGITVTKESKGKNGFSILVEENQMVQALDILRETASRTTITRALATFSKGRA